MNHRTRNIIIVLTALVLIVGIALFSSSNRRQTVAVRTKKITYTTFQTKLPESGTVMHPNTETVPTLVAGNIGAILVHAGDAVTAGQILATINNPTLESNAAGSQADYNSEAANVVAARINEENQRVQYQANVATQKSNLDEAQRVYNADVALFAQKAIPRNTLDTDRAKLAQARVAYDQAVEQLRLGALSGYGQNTVQYAKAAADKARILNEQNQQQLGFTRIAAPHSGIIQTVAEQPSDPLRTLQPGDAVNAGQTIFTMAASNAYIVKAQVDEQDIINIHTGQAVKVTGEDFPGKTLSGHVTSISPVAVRSTDASSTAKQILTTIALDQSPAYLKDGMTVDVDIITLDVPHALAVPTVAIQHDHGQAYVYIVRGDKAMKQTVKTGQSNDTDTLITSGLRQGDVLIAEKNPDVAPGVSVTAAPSPSPTPSST